MTLDCRQTLIQNIPETLTSSVHYALHGQNLYYIAHTSIWIVVYSCEKLGHGDAETMEKTDVG